MTSDLLEENADLRKQVEKLENELTAEKEYNATLRKEIDEYTNSHTLCAKYKELEKENEELELEIEHLTEHLEPQSMSALFKQVEEEVKQEKQLIEAKELLNEFVEWANWQGSNCLSFQSIQDKAEQFIKEN